MVKISLLLFLLAVSPVFGQGDRGAITGTISDPAGGVVVSAPIQGRNVETGAIYDAASTSTGNYVLGQLPAGTYELTVTVPGFKKYIRSGLAVQVAQTMRIDIGLEVGSATESVTVTEAAPLLKTESGELSHNVSTERLDSLPILGVGSVAAGSYGIRNPFAAMQLAPGTTYQGNSDVRVNGAPANTQTIRIEGVDATDGYLPQTPAQAQPSVDAIQEMSIQTSNFAAEFGQAGGGVFNFTMKSGTNQYHGSFYDYFVNEVFNAGQPFTNDGTGHLIRPRQRRWDFGPSVGGPVWIPKIYNGHDKTFFFANYERFTETQIFSGTPITVPTLAYRQGDFGQALTGKSVGTDPLGRPILENAVYDPRTDRLSPDGQRIRDQFNGNVIPTSLMDPVAVKIQQLIPVPGDNTKLIQNMIPSYPGKRISTVPSVKIDHYLNEKRKLAFYFQRTTTFTQWSPTYGNSEGLPAPITAARGSFIYVPTATLNYDETIRPTLLLHMGIGYQHLSFEDRAPVLDYNPLQALGLKGATLNRNFPVFATMETSRGGMRAMGPPVQSHGYLQKPEGNVSLTWVKDNHTYKFGAELRLEGYPSTSYTNTAGMYAFCGTPCTASPETGLPSTQGQALTGGVGFPYASFLLGRVDSGNIAYESDTRAGRHFFSAFAQDTWKVTRQFTLDYGLRWDLGSYPNEQYGRAPNLSPTTPNPSAGGQPGAAIFEGSGPGHCNCQFAKNYLYAFGPRLGIAYQITPKTVLRAGFGISYFLGNGGQVPGAASTNPFASQSFGDPAILLTDGPPAPAPWPVISSGIYPAPGTINGAPPVIDQNSGRPARQAMWSIGLQREIAPNLLVEASYVGNRGVWWRAPLLVNINALSTDRLKSAGLDVNNAADRQLLTSPLNSSLALQRGFNRPPYPGFPTTLTVAQSLRPFPQFGTLNFTNAPLGNTWYDSLQAKVTKRYSYGLDFTYTFTWQKEETSGVEADAPGSLSPAASVNDVFNRPNNKYLSGYSKPLVSGIAANYTTQRWLKNRALSFATRDWTLGTFLQYASGLPIHVPLANNALTSVLFQSTFANRVPGVPLFIKDPNCHCINRDQDFILNPAAWADPAQGQFGTAAAYYGDYRYARRPSESLSVGRVFRIRERASVQIRIEFNNVLNRTQVANPTSTNAALTQSRSNGNVVSGFGAVNTISTTTSTTFSPSRNGTAVVRFLF